MWKKPFKNNLDSSFLLYLELKKVNFLPIRAVQSENVPSFANLKWH